jgi:hypothetical protein
VTTAEPATLVVAAWMSNTTEPREGVSAVLLHLHYDPREPHAVQAYVTPAPPVVLDAQPWVFDRSLLKRVLLDGARHAGEGAVVVGEQRRPNTAIAAFQFATADGPRYVGAAPGPVREFATTIYRLVPDGTEAVPVDAWLRELLEGDQTP